MHSAERVTLARLPSGLRVKTTVHRYGPDGEDVPTLYVQAAQHGREINGTEVCRRLHEELDGRDLSGRLVVVPVADPLTFDRVSYTTPEALDAVNANMNRVWPGDADGSLHERMAARLWTFVDGADACIDLHTGSPEMLTHTVYLDGDEDARALAEAFGVDFLLAEPAGDDRTDDGAAGEGDGPDDDAGAGTDDRSEWVERGFAGKFRVAATREGVPTVTPELAHNKQLVDEAVAAGVQGVLAACRHVGVLPGHPPAWSGTVARNHLGRVRADDSGLFHARESLSLGDEVADGDVLGRVYDPTTYDCLQTARADRDGVVYSVAREATVTAGQTLVGVAEPI
jgi:predicted deacylase